MKGKGLVMIPYAYLDNFNTGINIQNISKQVDIYMKNCCVASISARTYCGENTDVAVVANIDIPSYYAELLKQANVQIITLPFDEFSFGNKYKWSLAFYKLCALAKACKELNYDYYAYLDTDVYVQDSFDKIWEESDFNIQLYDINEGRNSKDYLRVLAEIKEFDPNIDGITHYGGEFFAANKDNTIRFVEECYKIYNEMIERDFVTSQGDEFITSIAAHRLKSIVKNAGAYIYRYWTGTFRLVQTNYKNNPVVVLHCPAEKESGIIRLFNWYFKRGRVPSKRRVHRMLNLGSPSLLTIIKIIIKKILKIA